MGCFRRGAWGNYSGELGDLTRYKDYLIINWKLSLCRHYEVGVCLGSKSRRIGGFFI